MDPNQLGLILKPEFLKVLYPDAGGAGAEAMQQFVIYHYNGIAKPGQKVL